jgi:hypothetical protein
MDDKVTRVEAVTYLQGVSGHGVVSTLFLSLTAGLAAIGRWGTAMLTVIVAYGVAANGVSMYAWDAVHARIRPPAEDDGPDRELRAHRLSAETKADLAGGFVIAAGIVGIAAVGTVAVRYGGLDGRTAVILAGGALAVGKVGALLRQYLM